MKKIIILLLILVGTSSVAQELTTRGKTWNPEKLATKLDSIVGLTPEEKAQALTYYTDKEQLLWDNKLNASDANSYESQRRAISRDFSRNMKVLLGARRYRIWRKRLADERAGIVSPFEY